MKTQTQKLKLPVYNFDHITNDFAQQRKRHGELLPNDIRAIICGPSKCGKTNALLALIIHPNGLRFSTIYLYSKTLKQPKYEFLRQVLEPMKEVKFLTFSDNTEVIPPESASSNSLMIFDDIACEKQNNVKAYFCLGRHQNVDSFYLCQSYAHVPKHLIRENVNFLVIFRQDLMNLRHIYDDHVNTDMSFEQFKNMSMECWNTDDHGFIVVDKNREMKNGRYRNKFDKYFINNIENEKKHQYTIKRRGEKDGGSRKENRSASTDCESTKSHKT